MRGRLGAYTRWANADAQERFAAVYRTRQGLQAKSEREVDRGQVITAGASPSGPSMPARRICTAAASPSAASRDFIERDLGRLGGVTIWCRLRRLRHTTAT